MTTRPYSTQILVVIREFDRINAQASAARCVRTRQSDGGIDERKCFRQQDLQVLRQWHCLYVSVIRGCDRAGVPTDSGSCIDPH